MGRFEETKEYKQMLNMQPACDRVLKKVFGEIEIKRTLPGEILDKNFAIDLTLDLHTKDKRFCGQITGQEKTLSYEYSGFKTFTMEFWQDRYTREEGEFFKIASQFYLSGYSDESGIEFLDWHIIKMFDFMMWVKSKYYYSELLDRLKPSAGSKASFIFFSYEKDKIEIPLLFDMSHFSTAHTTRVSGCSNLIVLFIPQNGLHVAILSLNFFQFMALHFKAGDFNET